MAITDAEVDKYILLRKDKSVVEAMAEAFSNFQEGDHIVLTRKLQRKGFNSAGGWRRKTLRRKRRQRRSKRRI